MNTHKKVTYRLPEAKGYDAHEKLITERAKQLIESILTAISPKETILIGLGGRHPYCIENESGLSLLKEQECKHIFAARPEKDGYIVSEIFRDHTHNGASHHRCPCTTEIEVDSAKLTQLIGNVSRDL